MSKFINKLRRKSGKDKGTHSVFSNIIYILKLMFSISPGLVVGNIAVELVARLPGILIPVVGIKFVIDEVQGGGSLKKIFAGIAVMAVLFVFGEISKALFFELYAQREFENLHFGIHKMLYEKAVKLDLASFDDASFYSDFILAVETSSENLQQTLMFVTNYIVYFASFASVSAALLTIDPVCLVIVLVFVLSFIPVSRRLGDLQAERRREITEKHRRGDYFARLFYLPDYAGEMRMNSVTPLLMKRFKQSADEIVSVQKKYVTKIESMYFLQHGTVEVIGFMLVLTLYIGYKTIVAKTMTTGDFVAAFNGAVQIGSSVMFMTVMAARTMSERSKLIEKYRTFLARPVDMKNGEHTAECSEPETVTLKNVGFTYPGSDEPVLKNIDLEIKPYEKIALVGYNGAGKTTLTNLLLRLYDVTDGEITVGERNIKDETISSHRNRFAAVFQDFKIFGASVGENVALSEDYDAERVLKALAAAGFDKELPNGTETVLMREFDDGGLMLSGGEQQKIAIARAFYKKCPYIILDEPSANLDPISEYELNRAIANAARDKTVIFISHRLSTTRIADRIVMMENGEAVEIGTHDELMAKNGKYAYMFRLQAEKYRENN